MAALPVTEGPRLLYIGSDVLLVSRSWAAASDEDEKYDSPFAGLWRWTHSSPRNADVALRALK